MSESASPVSPRSGSNTPIVVLAAALVLAGLGIAALVFLRAPAGPALQALEPGRARVGETVTLKGTRFGTENIVLFGDRTGRIVSAAPGELRVEVPELAVEAGAQMIVPVRVIVGSQATAARDLVVYREAPAVAAVEPASEPEGAGAPPAAEPAAAAPPAGARPSKPAPGKPAGGRPAAPAAAPAEGPRAIPAAPLVPPAQRRFVLERTWVASNKRVDAELLGFDTAGVEVKRAPDVVGRVDFEVQPEQVKPGDKYTVKVYLINDGKKAIKVKEMFVATSVNGRLASGPVAPRAREIAPRKKELIGTFSDAWKDTTATWAFDVTVTSERGDVYKNQVVWR